MSESNKQQLAQTLLDLDREDQAWVINFLVQNLLGITSPIRRTAKKAHRDMMSDEQWEDYFAGKQPKELSEETVSLSSILENTSGKTIKPLEKWL